MMVVVVMVGKESLSMVVVEAAAFGAIATKAHDLFRNTLRYPQCGIFSALSMVAATSSNQKGGSGGSGSGSIYGGRPEHANNHRNDNDADPGETRHCSVPAFLCKRI